jgi:tRNA modification GTPase
VTETIFAVSSGAAPAAIAVIRVSGPDALAAGRALAGTLPAPRMAGLRTLRDGADLLDQVLVIAFPGPATATGEDLLELHCHGGRAIVRAVEAALARQPGLRPAAAGEFTRRALANGRIDLAQAEGLADLIAAETEGARRAALAAADGAVSRAAAAWSARLTNLSARAEALIDFADEDDVPAAPEAVAALTADLLSLQSELAQAVARPPVERLRDGVRVVLAGPPNSGKSSLLNALAEREVAIATPIAGTTRDRIEHAVVRDGQAYVLTDVAGLRDATDDPVEAIGIARAREAMAAADLVVWLGDTPAPDPDMLAIHPRADVPGREDAGGRLAVSAATGLGVEALWAALGERAQQLVPRPDETAFNARQRDRLAEAAMALTNPALDLVLMAEQLRIARVALAGVTGSHDIEPLLDALFGRFCIGK